MGWRRIRKARATEERKNWWVIGGIALAFGALTYPAATGPHDLRPWAVLVFVGACLVAYGVRAFGRHSALVCALLMVAAGAFFAVAPTPASVVLLAVPALALAGLHFWIRMRHWDEGPSTPDSIVKNRRRQRRRFLDWARRNKEDQQRAK